MGKKMKTDDERYVALMDKYKHFRHKDREKALKYLDAAMSLKETGKVSDDGFLGGTYI
jgi:hypothetical protein